MTWRGALRRGPELASVVWEQKKAKDHAVSVEKIDQQGAPASERTTWYDREENLQRGVVQRQRGESLKNRKVVDGCSGEMVVEVEDQDERWWEETGNDFVVVIVVVFGDEGSLERDVSAANRRARVEDRDCCLHFFR